MFILKNHLGMERPNVYSESCKVQRKIVAKNNEPVFI